MSEALDRLQRLFAGALLDARADRPLLPLLRGGDGIAASRIQLYRDGASASHSRSLAAAYPVVHALVGAEYFAGMARAYASAHPSSDGDLNRFGADLADFIADCAQARPVPYLSDVAALDWYVHEARYAADAQPVLRDAIATLTPDALLQARFAVQPACAWLDSPFAIASIWRAHMDDVGASLQFDVGIGESALVVRRGWRVEVLVSSRAETEVLGALRQGQSMGAAIGRGLAVDRDFDCAGRLVQWLDLGLLTDGDATA